MKNVKQPLIQDVTVWKCVWVKLILHAGKNLFFIYFFENQLICWEILLKAKETRKEIRAQTKMKRSLVETLNIGAVHVPLEICRYSAQKSLEMFRNYSKTVSFLANASNFLWYCLRAHPKTVPTIFKSNLDLRWFFYLKYHSNNYNLVCFDEAFFNLKNKTNRPSSN